MPSLILFNKPFQVLSQFTCSECDKKTLAEYIGIPNVYAAGRLDYDSEGLLLLTDDGQLQHRIAHPNHKSVKTYWAQVEGKPNEEALQRLRNGIQLKDGPALPAKAKLMKEPDLWPRTPPIRHRENSPTYWLEIQISEGRNRQVRRMTAAIGHPTLRLIRASIENWSIKGLRPGEFKTVEVDAIPASKSKPTYAKKQKPVKIRHPKKR